jgi:hypothetical protein
MSNIVYITKEQIEETLFLYYIDGNHVFKIYKVISTMPLYPWRITAVSSSTEYNTMFINQHNAENYLINTLKEMKKYSDKSFSITTKSLNQKVCECGKEKHKFFSHSFWCPLSSN